jgi:hypothetical protein
VAASLVCLSAGAAHGQGGRGAPPSATEVPGLDISVRTGFERPLGDLQQAAPLSDGLSGAVPLVFEIGVRGNRNVSVGFSLERARVLTRNCPDQSCSATDYRFNAEAIFTARTGSGVDPWLGVGIGYEWLDLADGPGSDEGITGWTYGVIQAGAEIRIGRQFGLGPFASFSVGEYSSESNNVYARDFTNQALHEWLQFGLRGTVNL